MINVSEIITSQIVKEAKAREADHVSSGKLSASSLGNPLQWQVLKYLGVPEKEHDNYTYCKFQRGRDVEDFIFNKIKAKYPEASSQEKAEYRNCVGLIDIFIPATNAVIEIKSTANSAFRYIVKEDKPKLNHALQACLYALSKGNDRFSIVYVATDDYRCVQFECLVSDYKHLVDEKIDLFNETIKKEMIPVFEAQMSWQKIPKYSSYPEWTKLNSSQLKAKAKDLYDRKN